MYQIKLETFTGPFDLLLHLIKKQEIEIYDISISNITKEYLAYIDLMRSLDLDIASEFLVMAALLLSIKSKMLLPKQKIMDDETGEEIEDDPRLELVRQLAEYKKYKEMAIKLEDRFKYFQNVYTRPKEKIDDELIECDLFSLLDAFRQIIQRQNKDEEKINLASDFISINLRIKEIEDILASKKSICFFDLFDELKQKMDIIVTFLAVLELMRLQKISVRQEKSFKEIWLYRIF